MKETSARKPELRNHVTDYNEEETSAWICDTCFWRKKHTIKLQGNHI